MLTAKNLESFIKKYQTEPENIVREYCQHLFLSHLYQGKGSERLLFKGGTSLRIVFESPRFSQDLDFTGSGITQSEIETLFADALTTIEETGVSVTLNIAKDTTGGSIGNATLAVHDMKVEVHIEVSLRPGRPVQGTQKLITSEYIPAYTLVHLPQEDIVQGKLDALLNRKKPRDFYDLYFLLRLNILSTAQKKLLPRMLEALHSTKIDFSGELKEFLPKSHWMIIREFPEVLEREIEKFI